MAIVRKACTVVSCRNDSTPAISNSTAVGAEQHQLDDARGLPVPAQRGQQCDRTARPIPANAAIQAMTGRSPWSVQESTGRRW